MSNLIKGSVSAIQDYYLEHADAIYTKTFSEPMYENFIMVTTQDKLLLQSAAQTSVMQSRQAKHHSKGNTTLNARRMDMRGVKSDTTYDTVEFTEDAYHAYLFRTSNDPKEFPFQAFVIQMILDQLYEDLAVAALWNGVDRGIIPNAPNNPADVANGFRKLIRDEITAGNLTPYLTGQLTSANALDGVRYFVWDQLNTQSKRNRRYNLFCSVDLVTKYRENYEASIGSYPHADEAYGLTKVHGTNTYLVPQDGLTGSQMCLARPDNFWVGMRGAPSIEMRYESRELLVEIDWAVGMQFASTEELYVNEWI